MDIRTEEMKKWGEFLQTYHLPRWQELPTIDLYKDQVITMVEQYLSIVPGQEKILTSAMINNYVKHKMMPPPTGKRYNREHLAYLIAITVLKQILTVQEVYTGIQFQTRLSGLRKAYDIFCTELENSFKVVGAQAMNNEFVAALGEQIPRQNLALKMATLSVATKLYTQKVLTIPLPKKKNLSTK